jgi:ABC-type sugar transport system substrate-binding protein
VKKALAILLVALVVSVVFAGCCDNGTSETTVAPDTTVTSGTTATTAATTTSVGEATTTTAAAKPGPYKFAAIMYNWEDNQGLYLKAYTEYLTQYFDIEWEYVTAGPDADSVIAAVETLCSKGVDCLFNSMTAGFQAWGDICTQYKTYFTVPLNVPDANDRDYAAANPYYLGSASIADFTQIGRDWAEYLVGKGYKSFLCTGFVPGIIGQVQQTLTGFKEVIDQKAATDPAYTYEELLTMPEELFPSITARLSDSSKPFDLLFSTISTMDFAVANVFMANLVGQVKVAGNNADQTSADAFKAGVLEALQDNLTAVYGVNVVLAINALQGKPLPGTPTDFKNIDTPTLFIKSLSDMELYQQYVMSADYSVHAITGEELEQFIVSMNPDATWDALAQWVGESTLEKIAERHQ